MKVNNNQNDPASKGDITRLEKGVDLLGSRVGKLENRIDKLDSRMDKLDSRMDKLDSRMDKSEITLSKMAQQIDWLYRKEMDKQTENLIHDNRHEEVEEKLINHEERIVSVETFVQAVTA